MEYTMATNLRFYCAALTTVALAPAAQLFAHHGAAAHFDPDDLVSLDGAVTEMRFVNPHAFVHFDVTSASGQTTEWRCELTGATLLRRRGWTPETIVAGQQISLVGARARREANSCAVESMVIDNATVVLEGDVIEGAEIRSAVADLGMTPPRPKYLDNGQPNLSGGWIARIGGGRGIAKDGPPEPTEAGLAASERFDFRFDNPVISCQSGNIVTDWYRQSHINDIQQEEDRIVIRHGYLDMVRTIHLDLSEHPENLVPSVEGHSIGWWEEDTLVVDTVGFDERALIPRSEIMISEQAHVEEHFRYDEANRTLVRDFMVEDPLYLARPYTGRNVSDISADPYQRFNCVDLSGENNRRPDVQ
jgi:hypothetical protein